MAQESTRTSTSL